MGKYRNFSAEVEALAEVWSTGPLTTDIWTPTGRSWGTNSQPIEVSNENNVRGVAKPGQRIADKCLRAAHEKIVSDLAFTLGLPVPPVVLWDRGQDFDGDRHCAISAWAFKSAVEWPHALAKLAPAQLELGKRAAGAMKVFDTWVAASDRKNEHVLVNDDDDPTQLGLAFIDYAYALTHEWQGHAGAGAEPRPAFPNGIGSDVAAEVEIVETIEKLEEHRIAEIVNRIPAGYYAEGSRDTILTQLLQRRTKLRSWLIK